MKSLHLSLLILTPLITLAKPWTHQPNTSFCTPTGPSFCNFGWEWYWDNDLKQHGYGAWVYDRYCDLISDHTHSTHGHCPLQPGKGIGDLVKPLYHIDTSTYTTFLLSL